MVILVTSKSKFIDMIIISNHTKFHNYVDSIVTDIKKCVS